MSFKLKAWMIYLIWVGSFFILNISTLGIEDGYLGITLGSTFGASIAGGIILGLYYMIKSSLKRTKPTLKDSKPVSSV